MMRARSHREGGQLSRRLPVPCRFSLPPCLFPDRTGASAACPGAGRTAAGRGCPPAPAVPRGRRSRANPGGCPPGLHQLCPSDGRPDTGQQAPVPPALPVPGMAEQGKARRGLSPQPVPNSGHAGKRTRPGACRILRSPAGSGHDIRLISGAFSAGVPVSSTTASFRGAPVPVLSVLPVPALPVPTLPVPTLPVPAVSASVLPNPGCCGCRSPVGSAQV